MVILGALGAVVYPRAIAHKRGILTVETKPTGATVYIDGRTRGVSPLRLTDLEAVLARWMPAQATGERSDGVATAPGRARGSGPPEIYQPVE